MNHLVRIVPPRQIHRPTPRSAQTDQNVAMHHYASVGFCVFRPYVGLVVALDIQNIYMALPGGSSFCICSPSSFSCYPP